MRISKPKNYELMTKEEKEKWALDTGKKIDEARKQFRKFLENAGEGK